MIADKGLIKKSVNSAVFLAFTHAYVIRLLFTFSDESFEDFFLYALGLLWCLWTFSSWASRGCSLGVVHRLLIAVASLIAEHEL